MRITLGIKIIVACILSAICSKGILMALPKEDMGMSILLCLVTGTLVGMFLAWRVQIRMQKFSQMLMQLHEEKIENWENPFSTQEDFGIWAGKISDFVKENSLRKSDQINSIKTLSKLVSENFNRIVEIMKNIGTQNSTIRQVVTHIVEMNSSVQTIYEKVDDLSSFG